MSKPLTVLVTGATGKQGGGVARRLLERGHQVRAFTRKADSPAAKALAGLGAQLATGSLDDRAALDRAAAGVDAVFAMSTPFEAGMEAETRQGVTVADAAKAAGAYLVYTSVGSADKKTGIPHFDSKYEVEKHIAKIGAKASIVAPVYFMENATAFSRDQLREGVYATPLTAGRKLAQVAVADIAAYAVLALENPERFAGKRVDIAGDDVSGDEAVEILSRVTGKTFRYFQVPMDMIRQRMGNDGAKMYEWFERVGYSFDLAGLARDYPEIKWHSFEAWAREQDWKAIFGG
ncbi:MAG TPA: NmrA family NAD(P)-binding protein [Polyangiaceae bacterium]|nr:NmrA family NAD(P)-binding protein [Polyangiaceae bacterium]